MTIEETIQALRDELRNERDARRHESSSHEACVAEMSQMLAGIQTALIGSVHSRERGIRETVNTHDTRLDDQIARIKGIEDSACAGLTEDDVKKLKDMPAAAEVRSGLSTVDKFIVYGSVVGTIAGLAIQFLKK